MPRPAGKDHNCTKQHYGAWCNHYRDCGRQHDNVITIYVFLGRHFLPLFYDCVVLLLKILYCTLFFIALLIIRLYFSSDHGPVLWGFKMRCSTKHIVASVTQILLQKCSSLRYFFTDIVFCRTWYAVDIPKLYNPVTSLLLPPDQKTLWQGMKTVGQLKREQGVRSEPQGDSLYTVSLKLAKA